MKNLFGVIIFNLGSQMYNILFNIQKYSMDYIIYVCRQVQGHV